MLVDQAMESSDTTMPSSTNNDTGDMQSRLHPAFSSLHGDVILASRGGQASFRMHSYTLRTTSGFFREMYDLPQSKSPVDSVIYLDEDAEVLEPLLRMISGLPLPPLTNCDLIERILFTAEKYDMSGPISILRLFAMTPPFLEQPLRMYAIVSRYGWEEEKKLASTKTLELDLFDSAFRERLLQLPTQALWDLMELRHWRKELYVDQRFIKQTENVEERTRRLRDKLESPIFVSGTATNCGLCGSILDYYTWRELKYRIILEIDKRPAGDTIIVGLNGDWAEAKAAWRAKCPQKDCARLLYDKAETIRVIKQCIESELPSSV